MEWVQQIVELISRVGFPIAACLICFWYINKQQQQHAEETRQLRDVLENNTLAIQRLADKLEGMADV